MGIFPTGDVKMTKTEGKSQADMDWENRILCSDESCIGTFGINGRCNICGKAYDAEDTEGTPVDESPADGPTVDENHVEATDPQYETDTDTGQDEDGILSPADSDWENRILCSDESCIGVIGRDGKCKECGKGYQ